MLLSFSSYIRKLILETNVEAMNVHCLQSIIYKKKKKKNFSKDLRTNIKQNYKFSNERMK